MPKARITNPAGRPRGSESDLAASISAGAVARPGGTVTGTPRRWLPLEGAVLLAGSLIAYSATRQPWWLVPLAILLPDLLMAGYLRSTRLGAQSCNIAHSTLLPATLVGLGRWPGQPLIAASGLIWLAHVGFDRLLGYGLKYGDHFQHTPLDHLGRSGDHWPPHLGPLPAGQRKEAHMNGGNGSKTLVRRREGRMLAGVCAGLADYFGIDVTLVRVIAAVLFIMGGVGVLAYLVAWVITPEEGEKTAIAENIVGKNQDASPG